MVNPKRALKCFRKYAKEVTTEEYLNDMRCATHPRTPLIDEELARKKKNPRKNKK